MCTASLQGKKESQWGQQLNLESFTADLNRPQRWKKKEKEAERAGEETAEAGKFSEKRWAAVQCSTENSVSRNPQQGLQFLNNSWALALGWWELLRPFKRSAEGVELSIHCQLSEENVWTPIHSQTHAHTQIHSGRAAHAGIYFSTSSAAAWVFAEIIESDCRTLRTMGNECWSYCLFYHISRASYQV